MPEKALLAVDMAIATLKDQIKAGTANKQIALLQLDELLEKRNKLIKQIFSAIEPTTNNPPSNHSHLRQCLA